MIKEDKNKTCFDLLSRVLREGAYASIELNESLEKIDKENRPYITKLFYGVLDKSVQIDYIINALTDKKPKPVIAVLLKMGIYMIRNMAVPSYAAVNNVLNLAKSLGKGGAAGFMNAILRKCEQFAFNHKDPLIQLSYECSCPLWLIEIMLNDQSYEFVSQYFNSNLTEDIHIRHNEFYNTKQEFEINYEKFISSKTKYGYYVTHNNIKYLSKGSFLVQSLASCVAVQFYLQNSKSNINAILDLCAAPGGKSVYLKELTNATLTACDIHEHRVGLIKKYAQGAGCSFNTVQNDATALKEEWLNLFDLVVCDVPCSGIGVIHSRPDILINRKKEDIAELNKLQFSILQNASNYVRPGGLLAYSTCTVLKSENEEIMNAFLKSNQDFCLDGNNEDAVLHLYPHTHATDGFFVARLKRKE